MRAPEYLYTFNANYPIELVDQTTSAVGAETSSDVSVVTFQTPVINQSHSNPNWFNDGDFIYYASIISPGISIFKIDTTTNTTVRAWEILPIDNASGVVQGGIGSNNLHFIKVGQKILILSGASYNFIDLATGVLSFKIMRPFEDFRFSDVYPKTQAPFTSGVAVHCQGVREILALSENNIYAVSSTTSTSTGSTSTTHYSGICVHHFNGESWALAYSELSSDAHDPNLPNTPINGHRWEYQVYGVYEGDTPHEIILALRLEDSNQSSNVQRLIRRITLTDLGTTGPGFLRYPGKLLHIGGTKFVVQELKGVASQTPIRIVDVADGSIQTLIGAGQFIENRDSNAGFLEGSNLATAYMHCHKYTVMYEEFSGAEGSHSLAYGPDNKVYVSNGATVFRFDPITLAVEGVAGNFTPAYGSINTNFYYGPDNGVGADATLSRIRDMAFHPNGNLLILCGAGDTAVIRSLDINTKEVTTFFGSNQRPFYQQIKGALLHSGSFITTDSDGFVYTAVKPHYDGTTFHKITSGGIIADNVSGLGNYDTSGSTAWHWAGRTNFSWPLNNSNWSADVSPITVNANYSPNYVSGLTSMVDGGDGWIYFTTLFSVRRMQKSDGTLQTIYTEAFSGASIYTNNGYIDAGIEVPNIPLQYNSGNATDDSYYFHEKYLFKGIQKVGTDLYFCSPSRHVIYKIDLSSWAYNSLTASRSTPIVVVAGQLNKSGSADRTRNYHVVVTDTTTITTEDGLASTAESCLADAVKVGTTFYSGTSSGILSSSTLEGPWVYMTKQPFGVRSKVSNLTTFQFLNSPGVLIQGILGLGTSTPIDYLAEYDPVAEEWSYSWNRLTELQATPFNTWNGNHPYPTMLIGGFYYAMHYTGGSKGIFLSAYKWRKPSNAPTGSVATLRPFSNLENAVAFPAPGASITIKRFEPLLIGPIGPSTPFVASVDAPFTLHGPDSYASQFGDISGNGFGITPTDAGTYYISTNGTPLGFNYLDAWSEYKFQPYQPLGRLFNPVLVPVTTPFTATVVTGDPTVYTLSTSTKTGCYVYRHPCTSDDGVLINFDVTDVTDDSWGKTSSNRQWFAHTTVVPTSTKDFTISITPTKYRYIPYSLRIGSRGQNSFTSKYILQFASSQMSVGHARGAGDFPVGYASVFVEDGYGQYGNIYGNGNFLSKSVHTTSTAPAKMAVYDLFSKAFGGNTSFDDSLSKPVAVFSPAKTLVTETNTIASATTLQVGSPIPLTLAAGSCVYYKLPDNLLADKRYKLRVTPTSGDADLLIRRFNSYNNTAESGVGATFILSANDSTTEECVYLDALKYEWTEGTVTSIRLADGNTPFLGKTGYHQQAANMFCAVYAHEDCVCTLALEEAPWITTSTTIDACVRLKDTEITSATTQVLGPHGVFICENYDARADYARLDYFIQRGSVLHLIKSVALMAPTTDGVWAHAFSMETPLTSADYKYAEVNDGDTYVVRGFNCVGALVAETTGTVRYSRPTDEFIMPCEVDVTELANVSLRDPYVYNTPDPTVVIPLFGTATLSLPCRIAPGTENDLVWRNGNDVYGVDVIGQTQTQLDLLFYVKDPQQVLLGGGNTTTVNITASSKLHRSYGGRAYPVGINVRVDPNPALTITVPNSVAAGDTFTASVPSFAGIQYEWYASGATITGGLGTNVITLTSNGKTSIKLWCYLKKGQFSYEVHTTVPVQGQVWTIQTLQSGVDAAASIKGEIYRKTSAEGANGDMYFIIDAQTSAPYDGKTVIKASTIGVISTEFTILGAPTSYLGQTPPHINYLTIINGRFIGVGYHNWYVDSNNYGTRAGLYEIGPGLITILAEFDSHQGWFAYATKGNYIYAWADNVGGDLTFNGAGLVRIDVTTNQQTVISTQPQIYPAANTFVSITGVVIVGNYAYLFGNGYGATRVNVNTAEVTSMPDFGGNKVIEPIIATTSLETDLTSFHGPNGIDSFGVCEPAASIFCNSVILHMDSDPWVLESTVNGAQSYSTPPDGTRTNGGAIYSSKLVWNKHEQCFFIFEGLPGKRVRKLSLQPGTLPYQGQPFSTTTNAQQYYMGPWNDKLGTISTVDVNGHVPTLYLPGQTFVTTTLDASGYSVYTPPADTIMSFNPAIKWGLSGPATILSTNAFYDFRWTPTGAGTITLHASINWPDGSHVTKTFTITVPPAPAPNATISGPSHVSSMTKTTFSVPDQLGSTYAWSLTGDGAPSIVGATDSRSVIVQSSQAVYGPIHLHCIVTNYAGASDQSTFDITVDPAALADHTITAPSSVGRFASSTASVTALVPTNTGATGSYAWSIQNGVITSSSAIQSITFYANSTSDCVLTCTVYNVDSAPSVGTATITTTAAAAPNANVTAAAAGTLNANASASVPAQPGSTYLWSVSGSATIVSGQGTNTCTYTDGTAESVTVSCTVTNFDGVVASGSGITAFSAIQMAYGSPISYGQTINDTLVGAPIGTTVSGANGKRSRPTKFYSFIGAAGDALTITEIATSNGNWDTYLYLVKQDGTQVAADDDSAGSANSRIITTLPSSGSYQIQASSFGSNVGGFALTLTKTN